MSDGDFSDRGWGSAAFIAPHCDDLVLHAPGECEFCDHYPDRQQARIRDGVNFTGHHEPDKATCPAELRRPIETLERWGGNVAAQGGTLKPHSEPPETMAWWLYGNRAEPAHVHARLKRQPKGWILGRWILTWVRQPQGSHPPLIDPCYTEAAGRDFEGWAVRIWGTFAVVIGRERQRS